MDHRQLRWSNAPETSADLCFHPGRRLALLPSNGDTRVARIHDSTAGETDGLRGNVVAYSLHQVHLTTESNVFVERLWRSVKYEEVYLNAYESMAEAKSGIGNWIEYYNHTRKHQTLGTTPELMYAGSGSLKMAA